MVITTEVLTFEKLFKIIDLAYEVNLQHLFFTNVTGYIQSFSFHLGHCL